jgi:hypothetical protein
MPLPAVTFVDVTMACQTLRGRACFRKIRPAGYWYRNRAQPSQ